VILGDLDKAEFYYKQAAEIFKKEGDRTGLAHVLGNLGSAYRQNGMWNSAIENCYQSLKTFEEAGDDLGIAQMTGSIGRIYADMGENDLAARYFEKSLSDFQRLGDKKSAAWVLDRLGRISRDRKEWDEALSYFQSSVSIFEEMDECSSLGVALSNLGQTFLEMNEPFAAREPLDRSVLLISKPSRPDYQNALYSLARAYGYLAEDSSQQAEAREDGKDASGEQQRKEASRLFSLAADRYQDLAGTLGDGRDEILMQAHLSRGRSYLCQISDQTTDAASFSLADKALTSVDNASAIAKNDKKALILRLKKAISAMKEIYGQGSLSLDERLKSRALTNSVEYLLGACSSLEPEEAAEFICQALKSISAGIEAERSGNDPAERFQSAASKLLSSKEYFAFPGSEKVRGSGDLIERAAAILKESASKSGAESQEDGKEMNGKPIGCEDERAAILAVAGAIAAHSLENIEKDQDALTWDEDLHLPSLKEPAENADLTVQEVSDDLASLDIKTEAQALKDEESLEETLDDDLPDEMEPEEITSEETAFEVQNSEETTSDDMDFKDNFRVKELILADGCKGGIRISSCDTNDDDDEGFLVTVKPDMIGQDAEQFQPKYDRLPAQKKLPNEDIHTSFETDPERAPAREEDAQQVGAGPQETDTVPPETPERSNYSHEDHEQAFDTGVEDLGPLFKDSPSAHEVESEALLSIVPPKAIFLLKVLTILVALLLAIEMIIYLI
jgi:tetratricopeptide (TPR) repeat protein